MKVESTNISSSIVRFTNGTQEQVKNHVEDEKLNKLSGSVEKVEIQTNETNPIKAEDGNQKSIGELIDDVSQNSSLRKIGIKFSQNEDPECRVVNIVDAETNETIRQIPSEEMLEIAKRLDDFCESKASKGENSTDNRSVLIDTQV